MTHNLFSIPHACEQLTKTLRDKFPNAIAIFTGRAGVSLWAEALDSFAPGDHLVRYLLRKPPTNFVDADEKLEEKPTWKRSDHLIKVKILGVPEVDEQQKLLDTVFAKRKRPVNAVSEVTKGDSSKDRYELRSEQDPVPFFYLVEFVESAFPPQARRLRSSVLNLTVIVEDPNFIAAETMKSLCIEADVTTWSVLLILHELYHFAHRFLSEADLSGSPFDDAAISVAQWSVDPFDHHEPVDEDFYDFRIKRNVNPAGKGAKVWKDALLNATHFFLKDRKVQNQHLASLHRQHHNAEFPLWPKVSINFVPQTRDPSPPPPPPRRRRDGRPPDATSDSHGHPRRLV